MSLGGRAGWLVVAAVLAAGCDRDPVRPNPPALAADLSLLPDSLAPQGTIRIRFNRRITPNSALDPSNFVVTDTCTGLRVPGSLRMDNDSTIVFTPSTALPFLSVLAVRVQNILDVGGAQLPLPVTFARTVQGPPIGDVSWSFLNSPTSEDLTGVSFVDDNTGFLSARNGTVYRTDNGGVFYAAIFKNNNIFDTYSLKALNADTLYMLGVVNLPSGSRQSGLLISRNGGLHFDTVGTVRFSRFTSLSIRRAGAGRVVGLAAGSGSTVEVYRYDSNGNTFTPASGLPPLVTPQNFIRVPLSAELSPDSTQEPRYGVVAVARIDISGNSEGGEAYASTDGGRSFSAVAALPANTSGLWGANFINATDALFVGDSSTVLRYSFATNTVTRVTAGIPQTFVDTLTNTVTRYRFYRSQFAPDGQTGWIVGQVTVQPPGAPAAVRGVILQTSDGGQTWRQQAIQTAGSNGIDYPTVIDLQVRSASFAALAGNQGLVAVRRGTQVRRASACSFTPGPAAGARRLRLLP